jgi:acyl-CoA synthetase (AMP-forming)/AMP-acid ligase II
MSTLTLESPMTVPRDTARRSVLDLLEDAATGHGTVRFLASDTEATSISTLWAQSGDAARWITDTVGAGSTIAALLSNTRPCAAFLIGAWRAGCTVASLPLPGRGISIESFMEQLGRFCAAAGAETLMVDAAHARLIESPPVRVHTYDEVLSGGPTCPFDGGGALVQFTSGSLGTPKGIFLSLEAVGANVEAIISTIEPDVGDSSCSWLPLSHDMGLIGLFLTPLAAGAPRFGHHDLVLMTPEKFVTNPNSWLRTCSEFGSTFTVVPNFALELAVRTATRAGSLDLCRVRVCIVGSESVRADTLKRFTDAYAPHGFQPRAFCPAYGMAEATVAVTAVRPQQHWRAISFGGASFGGPDPHTLVSTGPPIDGVDVRVPGPEGAVGQIEFRSPSLLDRYIGAELRLTDDGYFRTSDLGLVDGGELFVIGRSDEVIIVAGRNLYPADIETALPDGMVRPGCVAAVEAPDGGLAIVAEATSSRMEPTELDHVCRSIRGAVAVATGVGAATVAFVHRGTLLKTPSGKLRRLAIRAALAEGESLLWRKDFA